MLADKDDLTPRAFPSDLRYTEQEAGESLEKLFAFANEECDRAINWYYLKKRSKRIAGYTCRVGSILAATLAGIIPILGEIYKTNEVPSLSPAWATIAIAIAAVLIALDRLGGYTSGWVRYIRSGQILGQLQSDFRVEWEKQRLAMQGGQADLKVVQNGLEMCKDFLTKVHTTVRAETDQWAREFQQILIELEQNSKK